MDNIPHQVVSNVLIRGGEPLEHPDLQEALTRLTRAGHSIQIDTDLPHLGDDLRVRPFAPHDVLFRVRYPTSDPDHFAALTHMTLDQVEFGLRNLSAFAYAYELVVPVTCLQVGDLAETIRHLFDAFTPLSVTLEVAGRGQPDDPSWALSASWDDLADQLRSLDTTQLRPRPRLRVLGGHPLALPLDELQQIDLRTEATLSTAWQVPEGYLARHGPPRVDGGALARRRTVLARPLKERPCHRGHPLDGVAHATSLVLLRPRHAVHAFIERLRPGRRYLTTYPRHGLAVIGRFNDEVLQQRFRTLARAVHVAVTAEPPQDLARLRAVSHILRRSMRERYDDQPMWMREEGQ